MRKFVLLLTFYIIFLDGFSQVTLQIDTSYLPLQKFKVEFNDKSWVDSIGVYFNIEYLKAFDEPPIYCCQSDSMIRILTIPSFEPATIIQLFKQDSRYIIQTKISNKVGLDNSYLDAGQLKRKDKKRFWEISNNKIPQSEWTEDDQRIYDEATVRDTEIFSYSTEVTEISLSDWNSIFEHLNSRFYKLNAKPEQFRAVADGYSRLVEAVTANGYIALSRGSAFPEEQIVQELTRTILNLSKYTPYNNR
ncbi:hypothetical protein [Marinoscillum sp. MHG1-6]|uniref:hypothetical protein n=1 Tax=Marinoscillum sp. MHG1-6 TaxID=2959627 RepID=UPI002157AA30|nr:hypothetical protein [Marinoscillum sp. MHG1-6]